MEKAALGRDAENRTQSGENELARGLELFNEGRFFQAHEVWEDWWRTTTRPEKPTIQGMIQIAVAIHHATTGNLTGACSVMLRGLRNLEEAGDHWRGVNLRLLREDARACIDSWNACQRAADFKLVRK